MTNAKREWERWLQSDRLTAEEREEIKTLSPEEIEDRFDKDIAFGTAGLRGVMAAGTNRMNRFTVRRAATGLAGWLIEAGDTKRLAVIAYDSRNLSAEFALETALALAARGVRAWVFESLRPTPELSFAVRYLKASAGVVITASHNPAAYNGFKAYGPDGGQMANQAADACLREMNRVDLLDVPMLSKEEALEKGLLRFIGEEIDAPYIEHVLSQRTQPRITETAKEPVKIVYTPLHGAGSEPVRRALQMAGHTAIYPVAAQLAPDGNFPTVVSPNPENPPAFALAKEQADRVGADLILGTDPDCDRMAMAVRNGESWRHFTGNQFGCLLLEYLLRTGSYASGAYAVTTIVSTRMAKAICDAHGVETVEVLTGFKYIAETIERKIGEGIDAFVLGFEESCGYLTGGYIRDKDAVIAATLAADMALDYQEKGLSLSDAMDALYEKYGYFLEKTISFEVAGLGAMERIRAATKGLREMGAGAVAAFGEANVEDMLTDTLRGLPKSDVLLYTFPIGWMAVRPSGTEPKLKVYIGVKGETRERASALLEKLEAVARDTIAL